MKINEAAVASFSIRRDPLSSAAAATAAETAATAATVTTTASGTLEAAAAAIKPALLNAAALRAARAELSRLAAIAHPAKRAGSRDGSGHVPGTS
jgi:hypothetical protein